MRLLETFLSVIILAAIGATAIGASEVIKANKYTDDAEHANGLAISILASVLTQPYGSIYDIGTIANPHNFDITLNVKYHDPLRVPTEDENYPDLGLQKITVSVSGTTGQPSVELSVLKGR